jgi:hypothetical protein
VPKIEWIPVEEILNWDASIDYLRPEDEEHEAALNFKNIMDRLGLMCREDENFHDMYRSIQYYGFRKANRYRKQSDGTPEHGDGHHRLFAAVDLGYSFIPMIHYDSVSGDSWEWRWKCSANEFIPTSRPALLHPANPLPTIIIEKFTNMDLKVVEDKLDPLWHKAARNALVGAAV